MQKLNAAVIPPDGALQDWEIFMGLLDAAGETTSYSTPADIFRGLSGEIVAYRDLDYEAIGDQGIQLGSGGAGAS